jgi:hypothetical protein
MTRTIYLIRCIAAGLILSSLQLGAQALSGVYTINSGLSTSGTNFQTFTDFATALNTNGVSGAVTVNVVAASGPYNEQVTLNTVSGVSSANRVTINGNGNVLSWGASSSSPWTLGLNGTDYITVNNLNVEGTGSSYALVCKLSGGADNNSFNNCTFKCNAGQTASGQCPFSISSSMTSALSGGSASGNYNTVNSCTLSNGYYGFISYGPTSGAYTNHNTVMNSTITDFYYYGVYFSYNQYFTFRGNRVDRLTRTATSTLYPLYGIYNNGAMIDGNTITKLFDSDQGSTAYMYWYMYYQGQAFGARNSFRNNVITDIKHNGTMYLYMYNGGWDIVHNTFDWDYTGGNHTGYYYPYFYTSSSSYAETNVFNNIITMRKPGSGTRYGIYASSSSYLQYTNIDNNDIVMGTGSGGNYYGYLDGTHSTFASWQNEGVDLNGVSIDPVYVSATDLHPTATTLNNLGKPVMIPVDHDGMPRSGSTPDIGAYEFLSVACSGAPDPGSVVTPTFQVCPGESADMILSNFSSDLGITYQWQSSTQSSVGLWTPIPTATSVLYTAPNMTANTWYQVVVTCTNSSQSASPVGFVEIAGTTTNTVPYFEGFEGIPSNNKLPNCSWTSSDLGGNALTYTAANVNNRVPRTGSKFASFYYNPAGVNSFFTNGIWLNAGVTYSASVWYTTEYYGYNNWTDLSLLVGQTQTSAAQQTIASTNGPAISNIYKSLSNTFTVAASGLYYVEIRATSSSGSSAQYLSWDDLFIEAPCSINAPQMNVSSNQSTICAGQNVTMQASGADTYSWSTGDQTNIVTTSPFYAGVATYTVTGTNTITGCKSSILQNITVNPSPVVTALAAPPAICEGETASLYAVGANNYIWSNNTAGSVNNVTPVNSGTFAVVGSNQFNCQSTAVVMVTVFQKPDVGALFPERICKGDEINITGTGATSYQFMSPNSLYFNNPAVVSPAASTQYTVTGTDANGCSNFTLATILVEECTGISEKGNLGEIKLYPNPTSGMVNVKLTGATKSSIEVLDVTGRSLLNVESNEQSTALDLREMPSGVYYIKIRSGNVNSVEKLIKD